jgi:hypothetical protein
MLDYQSGKSRYRRGGSAATRVVAGVFSILFAAFGLYIPLVTRYQEFTLRDFLQPAALLSVAASFFCLWVAVGMVGRNK